MSCCPKHLLQNTWNTKWSPTLVKEKSFCRYYKPLHHPHNRLLVMLLIIRWLADSGLISENGAKKGEGDGKGGPWEGSDGTRKGNVSRTSWTELSISALLLIIHMKNTHERRAQIFRTFYCGKYWVKYTLRLSKINVLYTCKSFPLPKLSTNFSERLSSPPLLRIWKNKIGS